MDRGLCFRVANSGYAFEHADKLTNVLYSDITRQLDDFPRQELNMCRLLRRRFERPNVVSEP